MNHVLIAQRVRCILEEVEARRAAGEPWPPSAERIKEIIAEVDAENLRQKCIDGRFGRTQ
jgi:hypothetical protein